MKSMYHSQHPARVRATGSSRVLAMALCLAPLAWPVVAAEAEEDGEALVLQPVSVTGVNQAPPVVTEQSDSYTLGRSGTATKLDLTPRQTPQTLTSVNRQQLDDFNLGNANDALQAAGIGVQRVETDRTYFTARGLDVNNFQIDGIGVPFSSEEQMGDIDTFLYDRIEILKGANGLTSNPGNPSATINFVRKRPTRETQAQLGFSYGSWQTRRLEADVSGSLNDSGTLRGRALVAGQEGNSYLDRYQPSKTLFSGILEADLTDSSTATIGYSKQRNRPEGIMWSALSLYYTNGSKVHYDRSHNTAPDWTYWDTDDEQTFAELKTDWGGGWQTQLTLNYREIGSDAEMLMAGGVPDATTGLGLYTYGSKFDRTERQLLGDASVKGPFELFGRTHEVVLGSNWSRTRAHWTSSDDAIVQPLPPVWDYDGNYPRPDFADVTSSADYTTYRRSYYAAGHFALSDQLKLITGVNHSNLKSSGERVGEGHQYDKSKSTPYVGLTYDLNDNYSLYTSYTEIFSPQHQVDRNHALLEPIEGNNIEGGIKGEWFDRRLNASFALFRTKQDNTPEYAGFDAAEGFSYYQGVDTKVEGFEMTVAGQLTPGWEASAGLTHLFSLRDGDGSSTRNFIAQNTLYLATTYQVPQVQGLKVGGSVNWQSEIFREQGTSTTGETIVSRQGSYAVVNALASYDIDPHFNVSLNVNNLFDRKYLTSLYWAQSYYAPSRNATLSLSWKY